MNNMAIVPAPQKKIPARPPVSDAAAADFIQGAPDGRGGAWRKRKVPITVSLPAPLLDALDAHAQATGQSRAFVVNVAVMEYLKREGQGPGSA